MESGTRVRGSRDSSGSTSPSVNRTRGRYVVLKLPRDVEFVPQIAAQRVEVAILLFDLHQLLVVLALA